MQRLIRSVAEQHAAGTGCGYFVSPAYPARGRRQAVEKSALSAEAQRPDQPARNLPRGHRHAAAPAHPAGSAGPYARQRGAARPSQQSARAAAGIRSLAVHNPIHYMDLPELFMEIICTMTGKSPSTTGAGSEGRADQRTVQCPAADHRSEQRAGFLRAVRIGCVYHGGGLRRAAMSAWITTSACSCRRSGAGCLCRSGRRSF